MLSIHKPVLLQETVKALNLKNGDVVVDATLGGGGHAREILKTIGDDGILIGIDADIEAIKNFAEFSISKFKNIFLVNGNFADLENILENLKIEKVDAILADLGWSSDQLGGKGMSFMKDEELDMRIDRNTDLTAKKIVNYYSEAELNGILREYGEEKFAKNIARKICETRKAREIRTTVELAEIIKSATPKKYHFQKIHPATKTFQALRIEVNQELENLQKFIPQAIEILKIGGKIAVISFHSLEDRIVKNIFRENARGCICPSNFPVCSCMRKSVIKIITKKPIIPSENEVIHNPRSRSAKLRIAEKTV